MEPVVSNEKTISIGPPGGGGAPILDFLAAEGPSADLHVAGGGGRREDGGERMKKGGRKKRRRSKRRRKSRRVYMERRRKGRREQTNNTAEINIILTFQIISKTLR